jgi:hypothetical protein
MYKQFQIVPKLPDAAYLRKGQQEREGSTHGREKCSNFEQV